MPGDDTRCLASMGNYVFDTQTLIDVVTPRERRYTDLGGHVIPALTALGVAHVYDFSKNIVPGQDDRERGYWRDVGTIDSYFTANMDLIAPLPAFNLYNDEWPVYTYRDAAAAGEGRHGARLASRRSSTAACCARARSCRAPTSSGRSSPTAATSSHDAHVTDSILFPGVRVGAGARLHRCIVDKNVEVPRGYRIGHDADTDREQFTVSESGITVIEKDRKLSAD